MNLFCIVCLLQGLEIGLSEFQVIRRNFFGLNVSFGSNPEFLEVAALSGSTVRVSLDVQPLLAVAQHDITITFDCSSLISDVGASSQTAPVFIWERQLMSPCRKERSYSQITSSTDARLRFGGSYRSELTISSTNVLCKAGTVDGGEYRCTVEHKGKRQSREIFLLLIGSIPQLAGARECRLSNNEYVCQIGGSRQNITLPSIQDPISGLMKIAILRFSLGCDLAMSATVPKPQYTWSKDKMTVAVRTTSKDMATELNEEFYNLDESLLLQFFTPRSPIYIDENFTLVADFGANVWDLNSTLNSFVRGTTQDNLKGVILGAIAGNWTCSVRNELGRDEKSSVVSRCLTACDRESEDCVIRDGAYQCVCKPGRRKVPTNQSCPKCDLKSPFSAAKCVAVRTGTCDINCLLPVAFLVVAFFATLTIILPKFVCWQYRPRIFSAIVRAKHFDSLGKLRSQFITSGASKSSRFSNKSKGSRYSASKSYRSDF